jgi:aerobic carbon-monoxide dehydrogenase medium subunit
MIPAPLRYVRPQSLEEAFDVLADPDAKVLAGGQSLIPVLKLRVVRPSVLVDIGALGSTVARKEGDGVALGALMTWAQLGDVAELQRPAYAAVPECAAQVGDLQVRNRGTIGGSLAHADPAADLPAVVLALRANLRLVAREGEREIEASEFFLGPFTTALRPGEVVREIFFPEPPEGSGSAYAKVEHPASGFALAGAAALVRADGSRSVAVTGVGATAFLLPDGADPREALAGAEIYGDELAPAEYRRHLAAVVAERASRIAQERAS